MSGSALGATSIQPSQYASQGSVLGIRVIYPEQITPGHTFGVADDTAAMQAVIDYIVSNGLWCEVRLPPTINLNSAPRTDRQGNAILALPEYVNGGSKCYIRFKGAPGGSGIFTTQTGLSYSSSYGPPSVIGGPTTEQLGVNSTFSNSTIEIERINSFAIDWRDRVPRSQSYP